MHTYPNIQVLMKMLIYSPITLDSVILFHASHINLYISTDLLGIPDGLIAKNPFANAGDTSGLIPGLGGSHSCEASKPVYHEY